MFDFRVYSHLLLALLLAILSIFRSFTLGSLMFPITELMSSRHPSDSQRQAGRHASSGNASFSGTSSESALCAGARKRKCGAASGNSSMSSVGVPLKSQYKAPAFSKHSHAGWARGLTPLPAQAWTKAHCSIASAPFRHTNEYSKVPTAGASSLVGNSGNLAPQGPAAAIVETAQEDIAEDSGPCAVDRGRSDSPILYES